MRRQAGSKFGCHALSRRPYRYRPVWVDGSVSTSSSGINERGDIVGFYQDPVDFILRGFVDRGGRFTGVAPPGAVNGAYPYRITNDGRIVGFGLDANYRSIGFVASPRSPGGVSHGLQNRVFYINMQAMADMVRLPDELGHLLKTHREAAGLSKTDLAARAGKVREVIYRLEAGDDVTVSSLMAVLAALGLGLHISKAGMPSMQDVAARFADDGDEGGDAA